MRRHIVYLSLLPLCVLPAIDAQAQTSAPMRATAPEKMMPGDQAVKMRACDKLAMQQKIKMEDRAQFVEKCMADKSRPSR